MSATGTGTAALEPAQQPSSASDPAGTGYRGRIDASAGLRSLRGYPFQILSWVAADGYPVSVALEARIDAEAGLARLPSPAGLTPPQSAAVSLTGSHIRPQPGSGYDERRHVTVWGTLEGQADGELVLRASSAWGWDEAEVPFGEYSERGVPQSRRYFSDLSQQLGRAVAPRLAPGWLAFRAIRLPFLSATFVPVLLGIAVAAKDGFFDPLGALLTLVGAACIHLGLNVANDVFDTRSGADDANVTPTRYSGGSRVIQYGLVPIERMARISLGFYLVGAAIGAYLLATRFSVPLLVIGVLGVLISFGYTAPPLRFVYRGLGELVVALGFGPMMLLGAYVVQTGGLISAEAVVLSIPVAILVALILYVNEIPDRRSDARAGKRTLPVRLGRETVINLYLGAALAAFVVVAGGVVAGILPIPSLVALLALPLVPRIHQGLQRYYEQPYGLMAFMAVNIRLHLYVGVLLLLAYLVVIAAMAFTPGVPLFLR
jgi:1,4-dihydroxy-2-naphthoate octaprenyltransferase